VAYKALVEYEVYDTLEEAAENGMYGKDWIENIC